MRTLFSVIVMAGLVASPAFAGKSDPQQRMERLAQELNLDANQQQQVTAIMREQKSAHDALRQQYQGDDEQLRGEMRALRQSGREQISAVLTPQQQQQFEQLRAEHRAKRKQGKDCDRNGGRET